MCTTLNNPISNTVVTSMCKRKHEDNECLVKRAKVINEENDNVVKRIKLNNNLKDDQCEAAIKRIKIECLNEHMKDLWGCEGINNGNIEVIDLKSLHEPICKVESVSDNENGKDLNNDNKNSIKDNETKCRNSISSLEIESSDEDLHRTENVVNLTADDAINSKDIENQEKIECPKSESSVCLNGKDIGKHCSSLCTTSVENCTTELQCTNYNAESIDPDSTCFQVSVITKVHNLKKESVVDEHKNTDTENSCDEGKKTTNSGTFNSIDTNSDTLNSLDTNSGTLTSIDTNSGTYNSIDTNSGTLNSIDTNSGTLNSVDTNSGSADNSISGTEHNKHNNINNVISNKTDYDFDDRWCEKLPNNQVSKVHTKTSCANISNNLSKNVNGNQETVNNQDNTSKTVLNDVDLKVLDQCYNHENKEESQQTTDLNKLVHGCDCEVSRHHEGKHNDYLMECKNKGEEHGIDQGNDSNNDESDNDEKHGIDPGNDSNNDESDEKHGIDESFSSELTQKSRSDKLICSEYTTKSDSEDIITSETAKSSSYDYESISAEPTETSCNDECNSSESANSSSNYELISSLELTNSYDDSFTSKVNKNLSNDGPNAKNSISRIHYIGVNKDVSCCKNEPSGHYIGVNKDVSSCKNEPSGQYDTHDMLTDDKKIVLKTVLTNDVHEQLKYSEFKSQKEENSQLNSHELQTKEESMANIHNKNDHVKLSHTEWMNLKFKTWPSTGFKSDISNSKLESEEEKPHIKSDLSSHIESNKHTPSIPIVKTSDDDIPESIKNSHLFQLLMKGKQQQALSASSDDEDNELGIDYDSRNNERITKGKNDHSLSNDRISKVKIDDECHIQCKKYDEHYNYNHHKNSTGCITERPCPCVDLQKCDKGMVDCNDEVKEADESVKCINRCHCNRKTTAETNYCDENASSQNSKHGKHFRGCCRNTLQCERSSDCKRLKSSADGSRNDSGELGLKCECLSSDNISSNCENAFANSTSGCISKACDGYELNKLTNHGKLEEAICNRNEKSHDNCDTKSDRRKEFLTSLLYKTEEKIRNIIESSLNDKDVLSSIVKIEKDTEELTNCTVYDDKSPIVGDNQYMRQTSYDLPNSTTIKQETDEDDYNSGYPVSNGQDINGDGYDAGFPASGGDGQYLRQCSNSTSYSEVFSDKEVDTSKCSSLTDKEASQETIGDVLDLRCKNKTNIGLDLRLDNKKKTPGGVPDLYKRAESESFKSNNESKSLNSMKDCMSSVYNTPGSHQSHPFSGSKLHPAFGFRNMTDQSKSLASAYKNDFLLGTNKERFENERAHVKNIDATSFSPGTIERNDDVSNVCKKVDGMCKCNGMSEKCNSLNISRQHAGDNSRKRSSSLDTCKDRSKEVPDLLKRPNSNPERYNFHNSKPYSKNTLEEKTDDQDVYIVDSYVSKRSRSENSTAVRQGSDSLYRYRKPEDMSDSATKTTTFHQKYLDTLGRHRLGSLESALKVTNQLLSDRNLKNGYNLSNEDHASSLAEKPVVIPSKPPPLTPIQSLFFGSGETINNNHWSRINTSNNENSPVQGISSNEAARLVSNNEMPRQVKSNNDIVRNAAKGGSLFPNKHEKTARTIPSKFKNKNKFHKNRRLVQKDLASGMNHTKMPTQSFLLFKQVQKRLKAIAIEFNRNNRDHSACKCDKKECSPLLKALLQGEISSDAAFNFHYKEAILMKEKRQNERALMNRSPDSAKQGLNDGGVKSPTVVSPVNSLSKSTTQNSLDVYSAQNGQSPDKRKDSISSKSSNSQKQFVYEQERQNIFPGEINFRKSKSTANAHIDLTLEDSSDENDASPHQKSSRHSTWQASQDKIRMLQMNGLYKENTLHNPNLKQLQLTTDKIFQSQRHNGYIHRTNAVLNSDPTIGITKEGISTRPLDIDRPIPTPRPLMPNWYMPQHIRMNFPMAGIPRNIGYNRMPFSNKSCTITKPTGMSDNREHLKTDLSKELFAINGYRAKTGMMPTIPPPLIPLELVARK